MLSYHANNITAGMGDMSHGEIMEYCEEMCGPGSCDDIHYDDLPDDSHCQRTSSHGYYGSLDRLIHTPNHTVEQSDISQHLQAGRVLP